MVALPLGSCYGTCDDIPRHCASNSLHFTSANVAISVHTLVPYWRRSLWTGKSKLMNRLGVRGCAGARARRGWEGGTSCAANATLATVGYGSRAIQRFTRSPRSVAALSGFYESSSQQSAGYMRSQLQTRQQTKENHPHPRAALTAVYFALSAMINELTVDAYPTAHLKSTCSFR